MCDSTSRPGSAYSLGCVGCLSFNGNLDKSLASPRPSPIRWAGENFRTALCFPHDPHPACGHPMTRARPFARPSRASGLTEFLSPLPKRLKSYSHGRGRVALAETFANR